MSDDKKVDVPAELPPLLKNYTKAAIRTQPEDLLKWFLFNSIFRILIISLGRLSTLHA